MDKKAKSKNIVTINWEEEEGAKFLRNPGEYVVNATAAELDDDDEGKQFINWTFTVTEGKGKGSTITTRTFLTPKALWKLRELLECMGIEVNSNSVQDLDLDEIIESGEKFVIEVEEGNEKPDGNGYYMTVSDYMPYEDYTQASEKGVPEESEEEEEPEEKPAKSKKAKKKSKEPEIDEDEIIEQMEEEIDELGLDIDLDDYDTLEEKQEAFEKAKKKVSKKSKKKEEPEEDEDDEEEEETTTYTVEEIESLGTKQLKIIAEEIGLELDEEASTRSKRRSVISGLRKAGLLEE